ncbi:alpha/beta hydrolase family protein [Schlesneria sp. T3-172]|uniref:alpha/beta hydrolase family protein n=1 Tax=Schlesneria sphaerica TaxID=3373610 RepID=UPI0037C9D3FF
MSRNLSVVCIVALSSIGLWAQETPSAKPGDAMMESHLILETARLSSRVLEGAQSREEWEAQRDELKRRYLDMLGLWPLPERTPLNATVTGTLELDDVHVEKLHFQSSPGLYVTGNLYRPAKVEGKLPAVLYVCGHANRGRDGNKTGYQHHGRWFASHGYICLMIDTLQLGEIAGLHHGTYREQRWWWHSAGYTPAGVECWNGIRALDYLTSRADVDADKLAVTGRSGGGAATLWITAADDRVKVCVPVSGLSDLQTYVSEKVCDGHCDCMFMYNTYRWEWTTLAALIAPRPMLFENSGYDPIFPMPGNERIRERLAQIYGWYEKSKGELFDVGVTPGGHLDNQELRLMAYRWINRHLKNDNADVDEPKLAAIEGKLLRVFPEDSDLPSDRLNAVIDETFVPRANPVPPTSRDEFLAWSSNLRDGLQERVFREWPEQVPAAVVRETRPDGQMILGTEDDILVIAARHEAKQARPRSPEHRERIWLVVLDTEDLEGTLPAWVAATDLANQSVVVISPRGAGQSLAWTRKNPPSYVERAHALVGRTVDAGRVYDIQSVARWLHEADGNELTIGVAGRGTAGVLGVYAALLESCISEVLVVDPPASHRQGPALLNVLRVLDVPDAIGLLAPRHATLIDAESEAFGRTEQAYRAAGYGDRLSRTVRAD